MLTYIVQKDQTLMDVALQLYGSCEAASHLVDNNYDLLNDHTIGASLPVGMVLQYDYDGEDREVTSQLEHTVIS